MSLWCAGARRKKKRQLFVLLCDFLHKKILLLFSEQTFIEQTSGLCSSISPLFTLSLQPGVTHTELLAIVETKRWAGSGVARFMPDFFKLAVRSVGVWDQRPANPQRDGKKSVFTYGLNVRKICTNTGGCVPHLYLVLWPRPQETLHDAQLDQELHTQELWQL